MKRLPWWAVALIGSVAVVVRLVPVLNGGGLHSLVSYDGAVYYAAAAGLAHGRLPYADFLLLHPPGIVLALLPFGLLGRLVGDPAGMLTARLAFLVLGAVNAVLVMRLLRPLGLVAGLVGGLAYAVLHPAAFAHRTITLEALAGTCLIGAMLLASRWRRGELVRAWSPQVVGVLLGLSACIKIWGAVMVVPFAVWALVTLGWRRASSVVARATIATIAVCLPFFLAAPGPMWRMVVIDQLGRSPESAGPLARTTDIIGLALLPGRDSAVVVALGVVLVLAACLLALRSAVGRLGVLVLGVAVALLLTTPTWFLQYAGLSAAPLAVVAGAALAAVLDLVRDPRLRLAVPVVAFTALAGYAVPILTVAWGSPFPGRAIGAALAKTPGCVTTDQPTALIESDLLRRNLARGCPLVVDLGGYTHHLPRGSGYGSREQHQPWQRFALEYLSSGTATVQIRHAAGDGFSRSTAATVGSWPVVARFGRYAVRRPLPLG